MTGVANDLDLQPSRQACEDGREGGREGGHTSRDISSRFVNDISVD